MSNHANMTTHKGKRKTERRRPCTSGRFLRAERGDGLGPASPHGDRCSRRVSDPQAPDRRMQPAPAPVGAEARRPRLQRQAHAARLHCSLDRGCSSATQGEGGRGDQSATSAAIRSSNEEKGRAQAASGGGDAVVEMWAR